MRPKAYRKRRKVTTDAGYSSDMANPSALRPSRSRGPRRRTPRPRPSKPSTRFRRPSPLLGFLKSDEMSTAETSLMKRELRPLGLGGLTGSPKLQRSPKAHSDSAHTPRPGRSRGLGDLLGARSPEGGIYRPINFPPLCTRHTVQSRRPCGRRG